MPNAPTDANFITADLPPEMRPVEGLENGVVAVPTAFRDASPSSQLEPEFQTGNGFTRLRIPPPASLPLPKAAPASFPIPSAPVLSPNPQILSYLFPLIPDVQCQVSLFGPASADHLEQLVEYLTVAVKKLREQEHAKHHASVVSAAPPRHPVIQGAAHTPNDPTQTPSVQRPSQRRRTPKIPAPD